MPNVDTLLKLSIQDNSRRNLVSSMISLEITQMSVHFVHKDDGRVEARAVKPRQNCQGALGRGRACHNCKFAVRRSFHLDETTTRRLFRQLTSRSTSKNGY
jgi:hypothetical protein